MRSMCIHSNCPHGPRWGWGSAGRPQLPFFLYPCCPSQSDWNPVGALHGVWVAPLPSQCPCAKLAAERDSAYVLMDALPDAPSSNSLSSPPGQVVLAQGIDIPLVFKVPREPPPTYQTPYFIGHVTRFLIPTISRNRATAMSDTAPVILPFPQTVCLCPRALLPACTSSP